MPVIDNSTEPDSSAITTSVVVVPGRRCTRSVAMAGGAPWTCTRSILAGMRNRGGPSNVVEAADVAASTSDAHDGGTDPSASAATTANNSPRSPRRSSRIAHPKPIAATPSVARVSTTWLPGSCSVHLDRASSTPTGIFSSSSMSSRTAMVALLWVSQPPSPVAPESAVSASRDDNVSVSP